jgi:hypothetical protein
MIQTNGAGGVAPSMVCAGWIVAQNVSDGTSGALVNSSIELVRVYATDLRPEDFL